MITLGATGFELRCHIHEPFKQDPTMGRSGSLTLRGYPAQLPCKKAQLNAIGSCSAFGARTEAELARWEKEGAFQQARMILKLRVGEGPPTAI